MMSKDKLASSLAAIEPTGSLAEAVEALSAAYADFAADAELDAPSPIKITAVAVEAGKKAMSAKLLEGPDYLYEDGRAFVLIPQSLVAFWAAVALLLAGAFSGATAVTPPPHASFASELVTVAESNVSNNRNAADAMDAIAKIMYDNATTGGQVAISATTYGIS